jgi:4'-phosphopantetheinyl transferase
MSWSSTTEVPGLEPGAVHVWRIHFPEPGDAAAELDSARALLDSEELARNDRFVVEPPRIQHALTRATLRRLAGAYLDRDPRSLRFAAAERGKPYLPGHPLRFNVSHSGRFAVLAFSRDRELGVDVEQVWERRWSEEIADRYFSANEIAALHALAPAARRAAFFWVWVRKEAYLKARGDGLYLELDSFDVTVGAHPAPQLLASRAHPGDAERWHLIDIPISGEYPAALLVDGEPSAVRLLFQP